MKLHRALPILILCLATFLVFIKGVMAEGSGPWEGSGTWETEARTNAQKRYDDPRILYTASESSGPTLPNEIVIAVIVLSVAFFAAYAVWSEKSPERALKELSTPSESLEKTKV